jgi:uncharacterized membrane protein YraQ (UPF0718 family)
MKRNIVFRIVAICLFILFLVISWVTDFEAGQEIGKNFVDFLLEMAAIVPCAFILIGLFEVWVKREKVEKHLGQESGIRGYIWAILLAGTTVGGLYLAFPVAYSLHSKGARLSVIFTYIGASAILRIPMTVFEASFLGIKFTLIRMLVSLPLVIFSAILLDKYLSKRDFRLREGK